MFNFNQNPFNNFFANQQMPNNFWSSNQANDFFNPESMFNNWQQLINNPFKNLNQSKMPDFSTFNNLFNVDNYSWLDIFDKMHKAVEKNNIDDVKKMLTELSNKWLEQTNLVVNKFIPENYFIKTQIKTAKKFLKKTNLKLDNPLLNDWRKYQKQSLALLKSSLQLKSVFKNFENELNDNFSNKVLSEEVKVSNINDLFTQWVKEFEKLYAKRTMTNKYQKAYADWVKEATILHKIHQSYIDKYVELFGLPSKREMDTTHKKLHLASKEIRALKDYISKLDNKITALEKKQTVRNTPPKRATTTATRTKVTTTAAKKTTKKPAVKRVRVTTKKNINK